MLRKPAGRPARQVLRGHARNREDATTLRNNNVPVLLRATVFRISCSSTKATDAIEGAQRASARTFYMLCLPSTTPRPDVWNSGLNLNGHMDISVMGTSRVQTLLGLPTPRQRQGSAVALTAHR